MGVTVVIPALNEAGRIGATLAALAGEDIVVADGGSTDATREIAASHGANVVCCPPGRGAQIAAGVAAARGDWLLLLHADTVPGARWRQVAADHMAQGDGRAGYFRFELDSVELPARLLERVVAWRCRIFGLPYGDQGLLISRRLLASVGGVRPLVLMEDVDLVRRIGHSRLVALKASATTSADRWERDGWLRRSARNLMCLALYCLGVPPSRILHWYRSGRGM